MCVDALIIIVTLVCIGVTLALFYLQGQSKEDYEDTTIYLDSPVGLASFGMPCNSQDNVKPGLYCWSGRRKTGLTPKF